MLISAIKKLSFGIKSKDEYEEYIAEFVYGGIDGTITTFAVVAGATGASLDLSIILILGVGSLVADGLSMSVGSFFSKKADLDLAKAKKDYGVTIKSPVLAGTITFGSFVLVGSIPLLIYIATMFADIEHYNLFLVSSIGTVVSLAIIGSLKSIVTKKKVVYGIFETVLLGGVAAIVAYYIGFYLERVLA